MIAERSIEETCEAIAINAMNGGAMAGMVFRHNDSAVKALKESVIVTAGAPEPRLEAERGFKVKVEIEIKSPARTGSLHALALQRLTSASIVRGAALASGLTENDNLTILDDGIGGDRENTKNIRKRTITIPLIIAFEGASYTTPAEAGPAEEDDDMNSQSGEADIDDGEDTVTITFSPAFPSRPSYVNAYVNPPDGEGAIGVRRVTWTASEMTLELDIATAAEGYVAAWFAVL